MQNRDLQRRLKKLTRSLSIKHSNHLPLRYSQNDVQRLRKKLDKSASASGSDTTDTGSSTSASETIPLFDCIFIAGLYHDNIRNAHVPFTRDHFPEEVCNVNQPRVNLYRGLFFSSSFLLELKSYAGQMDPLGSLTLRIKPEPIRSSSLTSEARELLVIVEESKLKEMMCALLLQWSFSLVTVEQRVSFLR